MASAFVDALPIPDQIRMQDVLADVQVHGQWKDVASGVQAFKSALAFVPYIVFGLFLLLFILLGKVSGGLIWFGSGLTASGLFFGGMVLVMRGVLNQAMEAADDVFLRFESLSSLADYTVAHVIVAPIVLVVIGVALIVLGVVLTRKRYGGTPGAIGHAGGTVKAAHAKRTAEGQNPSAVFFWAALPLPRIKRKRRLRTERNPPPKSAVCPGRKTEETARCPPPASSARSPGNWCGCPRCQSARRISGCR